MIIFKKIILEGFGSYVDPTEFKLNRPGLNIVIAENGSGKTTVFSALRWVISGKSLKNTNNVTTWPHLQPPKFKGTKVILKIQIGEDKYQIIRCKDYKDKAEDGIKGANRLIILKNKTNVAQGSKNENQLLLYKILGFNDEILINSVIFGQRMKKLIESSGPDKKKVFEEAFNATFIQDAKQEATNDLKDVTHELVETERGLELTKEKYNGKKALYQAFKKQRLDFHKDQEEQLSKVRKELKDYEKELRSLDKPNNKTDIEQTLNEAKKVYYEILAGKPNNFEITELKSTLTQVLIRDKKALEATYSQLTKDRYNYEQPKAKCPTCGGGMTDINRKRLLKETQALITKTDTELYELETKILEARSNIEAKEKLYLSSKESYDKKITKVESKIKDYEQQINDLNKKELRYNMLKEYIKSAKGRLVEISEKRPPKLPTDMKVSLEKLKESLGDYEEKCKRLSQQKEDLSWVVNTLFGNKGLKSYIFDTMLQTLNHHLIPYEQFIGFRPEFRVDLDSSNKDIYAVCFTGENMVFYEELSGGQQQLVDAVTAFALHDLISHNTPISLLVFDEPFESLSETNVDLIFELIQTKATSDKCTFLITHQLSLQNASTKVIRMSLDNKGRTRLKQL